MRGKCSRDWVSGILDSLLDWGKECEVNIFTMELKMRNRLIQLSMMICLFVVGFTRLVAAQEVPTEKPKPKNPIAKKAAMVLVPDAGFLVKRSKPISSHQIIQAAKFKIANRLCSKTVVDGVVNYDILHNGRSVNIVEKTDGEIEVYMTKLYGPKDLDELRTANPDLYMHVRAFPKTSNGDQAVRLSVEVDVVYRSKNKSELKKSHPEICSIYDRYVSPPKKLPKLIVTPRIIIQDEEAIIHFSKN